MKSGYSLIEVMIVLVIVASLAAIAFPYYTQHVVREKRFEAEIGLNKLAAALEQYYVANNTYENATLEKLGIQQDIVSGRYRVKILAANNTNFELTAEPFAQQEILDTNCAALILNSMGEKSIGGTGTVRDCWE